MLNFIEEKVKLEDIFIPLSLHERKFSLSSFVFAFDVILVEKVILSQCILFRMNVCSITFLKSLLKVNHLFVCIVA